MDGESTELSSESSYNINNFLQDALGNENYSTSEMTPTNSIVSTSSCCDAEITSSSNSDEDEPRNTIRTYRKMIKRQRKKIISSFLSSTNMLVASQESMLHYRKRNLNEQLRILSKEEEIQLSIMNQASKVIELLKNSKNPWSHERVESERIYSLAVLRLNTIFDETQSLKFDDNAEKFSYVKGTLGISKISIKLKDEFVHNSLSKYYDNATWFLCTVQHKSCVFGTQAVCAAEEGHVNFPDFFTFDGLQTNFVIKIKIFTISMKKKDPETTTKCWHKLNRYRGISLHSSRKIFDSSSISDLPSISSAITGFNVDSYVEVSKHDFYCKQWNLKKASPLSPLSGTINFQLSSSLSVDKIFDGFLTMYEEVGGFGNWERRWFVLSDFTMNYWNYPLEANTKSPIGRIYLQYILTGTIQLASTSVCPRPRTMIIDIKSCEHAKGSSVSINMDKTRYLLAADTMSELENWCRIINYLISCLRDWNLMKL